MWVVAVVLWACLVAVGQGAGALDRRLAHMCQEGDLDSLWRYFQRASKKDASTLFGLSALTWILYSDVQEAVRLHKEAKSLGSNTVPPLANIYLQGNACGGMADLFYVSAVTMKQLVDSDIEEKALKEALTTLITLTSDTGLPFAAEAHMQHALSLSPQDTSLRIRGALMTPGVYENISHIYSTRILLENRTQWLRDHLTSLSPLTTLDEFVLSPTFYYIYQGFNDRSILKTIHNTYATAYPALAYVHNTALSFYHLSPPTRKLRIGFVSAYFRHHSVCKLFCGVIKDLARFHHDSFEVFVYSSLAENKEDATTKELRANEHLQFISTGRLLLTNRHLVTDKQIDVLVYLDMGMDPAGIVWAAARLATVQMCLWGHPSTTALPHMDYYLSSERFHARETVTNALYTSFSTFNDPHNQQVANHAYAKDQDSHSHRFEEQLIQLDGLGIAFARSILSLLHTRATILDNDSTDNKRRDKEYLRLLSDNHDVATLEYLKNSLLSTSMTPTQSQIDHLLFLKMQFPHRPIILCPQFAPKLHPFFDEVLVNLLFSINSTATQPTNTTEYAPLLILLSTRKKHVPWQHTIVKRLQRTLTRLLMNSSDNNDNPSKIVNQWMKDRILWMEDMSPQEYLQVLYLGDVMLDPFPFGGGVTVLESLSMCTPVVTAPSIQTVPQLAAGILDTLYDQDAKESSFLAFSIDEYVDKVRHVLTEDSSMLRAEVCALSHKLFHANDNNNDDAMAITEDSSQEYAVLVKKIVRHLTEKITR